MTFLIYKIINITNKKIYIGKTNNMERRWQQHTIIAKGGKEKYSGNFYPIHAAIAKYGKDNFKIEIIEQYEEEDLAYIAEEKWIKFFDSRNIDFGYNLSAGGKGVMTNRPVSLETREKISKAQSGVSKKKDYNISTESRSKMSVNSKNNKGVVPIEIKQKILSLFNTGEYTKKQLAEKFDLRFESVRFIINYYKNGFKTEEEKREHVLQGAASRRDKPLSDECKEKISNSLKGTIFTETRKQNISNALKGNIVSQEMRDKISITLSGRSNYLEVKKQIIELFETGKYKQIELAKMFNLNYSSVKKIIKKHRAGRNVESS